MRAFLWSVCGAAWEGQLAMRIDYGCAQGTPEAAAPLLSYKIHSCSRAYLLACSRFRPQKQAIFSFFCA
ncbi:MAG: hypothetical protein HYX42_21000 [Polaromonas sp.]|nr:hypothetical protein [Polaromonas sp.]